MQLKTALIQPYLSLERPGEAKRSFDLTSPCATAKAKGGSGWRGRDKLNTNPVFQTNPANPDSDKQL